MPQLKFPALKSARSLQIPAAWRPVIAIAGIFFALTLLFGLHRYFTYFASFDQGIFNQVFWNNLHGRWFQSSLSSSLSTNVVHDQQVPEVFYRRLGQHFTPSLLVWLPFYALAPNAATLVVLQVAVITAAGLVLYALARQHLPARPALYITGAYYAANGVIGPTFSNFHDFSQIPLFAFTLLLALEKRVWWLVWVMAGLMVMIREDAGIGLFGIGVYLVLSRRFPRVGLGLCVLGFSYVVAATNVFMPLFSDDISRRFMMERFGQYASGDSASTLEILLNILRNPLNLLANLFNKWPTKLYYLLIQTLSLAFVPLISWPTWAIAGFPLAKLFLQRGESPLALHIRYVMALLPGIFYGAILWWATHGRHFTARFRRFWQGCIILSVLIALCYNPNNAFYFIFPISYQPWLHVTIPAQWQHSRQIDQFIAQIPPAASVSATTYVVPHLSSRREVLRLPMLQLRNDDRQVVDVDYLVADLKQLMDFQTVFKMERTHLLQVVGLADQLLATNRYGIVGLADQVLLMQRGATTTPELAQAWATFREELNPILETIIQKMQNP